MAGIVHSLENVTLIGGGAVRPEDLSLALSLAPILIAADGGANAALRLGHEPVAVIGDLDSITPETQAVIPKTRLHRLPDQDKTDFDKARGEIDAPLVLGVGFGGLRLDHELAVLNALARRPALRTLLIGAHDVTLLLPPRFEMNLAPGTRVSLFPLRETRAKSTGLHWPLDAVPFAPDGAIGTSNRAVGPIRIESAAPGLLMLLPRSAAAAAVTAFAAAPGWP